MTTGRESCVSRRVVLCRGIGVGLGAIAVTAAGTASAQTKIAQAMVQYQKMPKGDQQCSKCAQFVAPAACQIVDGTIDPNGWCIAFAPKT